VLKFSCRILEIFGSLGPSARIAQFVKLELINALPFDCEKFGEFLNILCLYFGIIYTCGLAVAVCRAGLRTCEHLSWKGA